MTQRIELWNPVGKRIAMGIFIFSNILASLALAESKTTVEPKASKESVNYTQLVLQKAPYDQKWQESFPAFSQKGTEQSAKTMSQQEGKRKIASDLDAEFFESKMSQPMKKFREDFLKVSNADQLDALLVNLEANYANYPADLQFIAAQLLPLKTLRGIVWRLGPTLEDTKMAHSLVVTQVKNLGVNLKLLLPTEQWQAGFDYVTQPFAENGKIVTQFAKGHEADMQIYVRNDLIPSLRLAAARLEKIDLSSDMSVWDNKLLYGSGSFPAAMDRYSLYGEVERHAALSNLYGALSEISYQAAYSAEGSLKMNQEISRLYGWDGLIGKVDGVPASKRIQVIRSSKYKRWGMLFMDGEKWTKDAFFYLTRSVDHGDLMWNAMKDRPISESFLMTNAYALAFQRPIANRFENLKRLVRGPAEVRSFITDEKVTVDLKQYYYNPPKDLKNLYAIGFEGGDEYHTKELKSADGNQVIKYRNYFYGRPAKWDLKEFQTVFPGVKTDQDLQKTARVLTQGWGTFAVATPLLNYLQ